MAYTSKHGVDDMVMLSKISNDGITENLKKRHEHDIIYAYIGHVLISVNPFKEIKGLYSDRLLKDYKGKYRYELPPHVYSLADDMYRTLINERYNQCVIISGESGAGKTEASKKIMQFIASVAGNSPNVQHVKDVILQSNPLLEAFGNAKTLRNNNSSRFGKYMEIQFDIAGEPEGGRINNYLLEKSRVVTRSNGERCFHIFYQLLAGADSNMQSELGLQGPDYYLYLAQSRCTQIDGTDDRAEFKDTVEAMGVMGIDKSYQFEVFRLLAAILYLGNVAFYDGGKDQAAVQDKQVVEMFAYLLQSDAQSCVKSMCFRTISTGTQGKSARVSTYACPQNVEGALYSRDALAKALYSRLFDWIIAKVNSALGWAGDQDCLVLGILDIYGFEIFEKNGFEQFCINYVNEKLQQIFIELTLKAEQEEYGKEGIKWEHIDFFNNKICCDLIELKKPIGILALLDDTCNFPKGTDDKFLQRLCESFPDHPHFQGGLGAGTFIIKHYAGDVTYNVEGFCDRNRDLLFNDLIDLAHCTKSQLVQGLFPEAKTAADKRRPTTAGFKIKESINLLVNALQQCNPHYIRCIKPNENKRANDFNFDMVNHQVKYLGLLENVRVRRAGYAYRHPYDKFFYRYRVCSNQTWPNWNGDFIGGTEAILQVLNLGQGEYQKGKTKIFIRKPETVFSLEELRERKVFSYANQIQRFFMKFSLHNYYYSIQMNGNQKLQNNKERRRATIERSFKGDYIGYRENFPLKAMIERNGKEKLVFGDRVNKYDRRMTAQRRIFIMTDRAVYIIAIEKNMDKDKVARQKKPWIYVEKRRIEHNRLKTITLSPNADNFFAIHVPGEYDSLLETRRKTEFICTALKYNPGVSIQFSSSISIVQKGGKKTTVVQFIRDQSGGANGTVKSKKVLVAPGMDKSSMPNLKAPSSVPTIASDPYGGMKNKGGPAPRGRGRGGSNNVSPPSNNYNTQAYSSQPSYETQSFSPQPVVSSGPQAKALYDFSAENADELSFHEGDIIDVLEQDGEWWKGSFNGQTGIFPYNYVEIIKKPTPSPNRGQTMTQPMRARGTANTGMPANRGVSNPSPNRGQTMAQPMTRGPSNPSPNRGQTMTAPMTRGVPSNRGQTMTAPGPNPGRMPMVMGMRGPPGRARGQ